MRHLLITTLFILLCSTAISYAGETITRQQFPACQGIVGNESEWAWELGSHRYIITKVDADLNIHIVCNDQSIIIARALIAQDDAEAAAHVSELLAKAQQSNLPLKGLLLDRGSLTGLHLRNEHGYVTTHAVLKTVTIEKPHFDEQRNELTTTAEQLMTTLPEAGLSTIGRSAMQRFLSLINDTVAADEDTNPHYLRQLVVHGWLQKQLPASEQLVALQKAIELAMSFQPVQQWSGNEWTLTAYANAFQEKIWTIQGPDHAARLQAHHDLHHAPRLPCHLLTTFKPQADPLHAQADITSARLLWGRRSLATWDPANGFQADLTTWREARPDDGYGVSSTAPVGFIPPHMVISAADGSILHLVTKGGILAPPNNQSTAEHQRFIKEAAAQLTDAVHLDLIGQVFFSYVHDSPDSAKPDLVGFRSINGDIHQTVTQTLNTCLFGMLRGDCDDLSEVYQTILTEQNKLAYVLSLPRHAACAWSELIGDQWTTYVLQTGQPVACSDASLAQTIVALYHRFDRQGSFDGSNISLLLRFAGENTRSSFSLSNRILTEAEYAKTLIAVQRDLYNHTYANGINTMNAMLKNGDEDPANWLELAGLYEHTGEHGNAVTMLEKVITKEKDPYQRIMYTVLMLSSLIEEEKFALCTSIANKLLAEELPKISAQKVSAWWMAYRIYSTLDEEQHHDLRQHILSTYLYPVIKEEAKQVLAWVNSDRFKLSIWENQLRDFNSRMGVITGIVLQHVTKKGISQLHEDESLREKYGFVERFIETCSFLDLKNRANVSNAYALTGMFAAQIMGVDNFDEVLAATPFPSTWHNYHNKRIGGVAQLERDLPWIRSSVTFWSGRLGQALSEKVIDKEKILSHIKQLKDAYQASQKLDVISLGIENTLLYVDVVQALITEDKEALDSAFTKYRNQNDKRSDAALCATISALAPHLGPTWFKTVLERWHALAATKPGYFTIAWDCVHKKAIAQALVAGAFAAQHNNDDPTFVNEFTYLQRVVAGGEVP